MNSWWKSQQITFMKDPNIRPGVKHDSFVFVVEPMHIFQMTVVGKTQGKKVCDGQVDL